MLMDEPWYPPYLTRFGQDHPYRDYALTHYETDPERVRQALIAPLPKGVRFVYQKHIAKNVLPEYRGPWMGTIRSFVLLRDPRAIIASYARIVDAPTVEDIGLDALAELFDVLTDVRGAPPLVLHSDDLVRLPERFLQRWCAWAGVDYDPCMLTWAPRLEGSALLTAHPQGYQPTPWHAGIASSTGFRAATTTPPELPPALEDLADRCRPPYERLLARCERVQGDLDRCPS